MAFTDAPRRLSCYALLARAAAELEDARLYERNGMHEWVLLDPARGSDVSRGLRQLGKASAAARDWIRVQQTVMAFNDLRRQRPSPPPSSKSSPPWQPSRGMSR